MRKTESFADFAASYRRIFGNRTATHIYLECRDALYGHGQARARLIAKDRRFRPHVEWSMGR